MFRVFCFCFSGEWLVGVVTGQGTQIALEAMNAAVNPLGKRARKGKAYASESSESDEAPPAKRIRSLGTPS